MACYLGAIILHLAFREAVTHVRKRNLERYHKTKRPHRAAFRLFKARTADSEEGATERQVSVWDSYEASCLCVTFIRQDGERWQVERTSKEDFLASGHTLDTAWGTWVWWDREESLKAWEAASRFACAFL